MLTSAIIVCFLCSEVQVRTLRPARWKAGVAEVVFIGSSYVEYGIIPRQYSRPTGAFSFPAMAANMAQKAFAKHVELWPDLKLVVIEIDEWSLLADSVKYAKGDYSRFAGKLQLNAWELPQHTGPWDQFWLAVSNLCLGKGVASFHEDMRFTTGVVLRRLFRFGSVLPATMTRAGNARKPKKPEFDAKTARQRVGYLNVFKSDFPEMNQQALVDLALDVRKTGAQVALITFPAHDVYNAARPPRWDRVIAESVARVQSALAPEGVVYWDFRDHPEFRDVEVYRDQDHLNRSGARRLAAMLEERISALLSRDGQKR